LLLFSTTVDASSSASDEKPPTSSSQAITFGRNGIPNTHYDGIDGNRGSSVGSTTNTNFLMAINMIDDTNNDVISRISEQDMKSCNDSVLHFVDVVLLPNWFL